MTYETILTIGLMAAATITTRLGGLWLMGRIKMSPFVEKWFKSLPGALLTAIVTPTVLRGGSAEMIAAVAVILTMVKTKSLLLAMTIGVGVIFLIKNFSMLKE
ncbi:MAG: AzlD domain-containing protein [Acidobacteria bacterium]|nr:AzlD domain-containing protein [Acidobacteriota bacterium]MCA1626948.1 AzlD domain-containing protein [Acidobacteriota bacterium]